jgi:hypothetical protein
MKKNVFTCIALFLSMADFAIPQNIAHRSTFGHQGTVTAVSPVSGTSFFSAGKDGTLIRWNDEGTGEHYQVSELEICLVASHPNGEDIAIYETDGLTVHRISIWNWQTLTKKYTKQFGDSITALSYTKKGSYLVVGTTSADQTVFLNPDTDSVTQVIREKTGIVSFIESSNTEASCVMYSLTGQLTYYDLKTGTRKAQFSTESNLTQTMLFSNNVFFAGVRDNEVFLILATTGKTLVRFPAINPLLCAAPPELSGEPTLYYAEISDKIAAVKKITVLNSATVVPPETVRQRARTSLDGITNAALCMDTIFLGSESGTIYSMPLQTGTNNAILTQITNNNEQKIHDIAANGEFMYALTEKTVYKVDITGKTEKIAVNEEKNTRFIVYSDSLIFWSKFTKNPVIRVFQPDSATQVIFSSSSNVDSVQLYGSRLIILEGNTAVHLYDLETGELTLLYTGSGIQDVIIHPSGVIIAKNAASNPPSSIISINIATKETVRLTLPDEIAFALTSGEEDTHAFTVFYDDMLYTNIGQQEIISYNTKIRTQLQRAAFLPVKIVKAAACMLVLNSDGSVSWFEGQDPQALATWHLTENSWTSESGRIIVPLTSYSRTL